MTYEMHTDQSFLIPQDHADLVPALPPRHNQSPEPERKPGIPEKKTQVDRLVN